METLAEKTILVTGGTGSFGRSVVNYMLDKNIEFKEIRIFSRDELKQEEMRIALHNEKLRFHIGDVRDIDSVNKVMDNVDCIFHAAALKQVPSCEFFPMQAVLTNIHGSNNVIESAIAHGVSRIVCLSTDKAAYPINAMGMTKAVMEKVAQAAARRETSNKTIISIVRYGNVMCTRGSVIPLFIKQIKSGRPITVTVPEMTRFLLPLRASVDLVLFAFQNSKQGDLFVKKAPASTVMDLAEAVRNVFRSDTPIRVIGIRHAEKIYETLCIREEIRRADDMGDYYRVPLDDRNLNYTKYFTEGDIEEAAFEDYTSHNTQRLNVKEVEELLLSLPEIRAELEQ